MEIICFSLMLVSATSPVVLCMNTDFFLKYFLFVFIFLSRGQGSTELINKAHLCMLRLVYANGKNTVYTSNTNNSHGHVYPNGPRRHCYKH